MIREIHFQTLVMITKSCKLIADVTWKPKKI